jgi:hypothetical protein
MGANLNVEITWVLKMENLMATSVKVMSYEGSESGVQRKGEKLLLGRGKAFALSLFAT